MSLPPQKTASTSLELAEKYLEEGEMLHEQEQYDASLEVLEKAKDIYLQLEQTKDPQLAKTLHLIGVGYYFKGDYKSAISYEEEAFAIQMEVLDPQDEATLTTAIDLASMYATIDQYEQALSYFDKVIELQPTLIDVPSPQGNYLHINLGVLYARMGDFGRAIPYFQKALQIAEHLGLEGDSISTSYNWLGICYCRTTEGNKAIETFQKVIDYNLAQGREYSERTAGPYYHLGEEYTKLGQYEEAIVHFKKALHIQTTLYGERSDGAAFSYKGLGEAYISLKEFEQAEEYLQKALAIRLEGMGAQGSYLADNYVPLIYLKYKNKDYIKSLQYAQKALYVLAANCSQEDIYDYPPLEKLRHTLGIKLLSYKAKAFHALFLAESDPKNLKAALENAQLSIDLLEQLRNSYRSDDSKLVLPKRHHGSYGIGMTVTHTAWEQTHQKEMLEQAFGFAEKAKAALLLASMQEGMAKATSLIPADLLQKEKALRTQLSQIEQALQQKEAQKEELGKETEIRALQVEYLTYQKSYLQLMDQLEADFPDYYQLKYQNQTVSIVQVQELLQLGELLIQYSLYEETLFIFAIDKHSISFKKIGRPEGLEKTMEAFEKTIFLGDQEEYCRLAGQLYAALLTPIEATLKGKHKLLIVTDGILQRLSFDALIPPLETSIEGFTQLPYLLKSFDIQYHYSATLLWYFHERKPQGLVDLKENFLGLAPIRFGQTETANAGYILKSDVKGKKGRKLILKSGENEQEVLQDLAETETEVKTVYELFEEQEQEAIALFYEMASKENLLQHIEQYKYVLLSTHGFSNSEHSALSGLNLYTNDSADKAASDEDKLYISDIMNLQLSAELVVLSSCESGVGKLQQGEGMMALHRAFLYAGVRNIVYSLFKVPQDSTSQLVQSLFGHVLAGDAYATALRKAKLELIENEAIEPMDWAGFALIGI
ncbi:MAG: CHAT domain-containing tetratricopeptide repeat protein [Chitinophagales bacterium]